MNKKMRSVVRLIVSRVSNDLTNVDENFDSNFGFDTNDTVWDKQEDENKIYKLTIKYVEDELNGTEIKERETIELNKQIENIKALESTTYKPLSIVIVGEVKSGKSL